MLIKIAEEIGLSMRVVTAWNVVPKNRLGTDFVIPRKKMLIPRYFEVLT
jgi:hypothetical protein